MFSAPSVGIHITGKSIMTQDGLSYILCMDAVVQNIKRKTGYLFTRRSVLLLQCSVLLKLTPTLKRRGSIVINSSFLGKYVELTWWVFQ